MSRRSVGRSIRFAVESWSFGALTLAAGILPRRWLRRMGRLAGDAGYGLDRRHRGIALRNLALAFGREMDEPARRCVARKCWRHFGTILMDTLAFPRFSERAIGRDVEVEGIEHVRDAYARGGGVLVFSGHYGHWELAALMQAHLGFPMHLVTRPLDNRRLERMLARLRGLSGNRVVHKRDAVREMLRVLREGGCVAIVIDQDAHEEGVFVPFFDRLASTTPTLATLALRTGAAVLPLFAVREPDGRYRMTYEPAVEIHPTGDRGADVLALTAKCTAIIERWVRRHPEQWLWMHRRWKTRPPGEDPGAG